MVSWTPIFIYFLSKVESDLVAHMQVLKKRKLVPEEMRVSLYHMNQQQ